MQNRRTFSAEFKARVVMEVLSGAKNAAEVCREHQIKPQVFASKPPCRSNPNIGLPLFCNVHLFRV